MSDDEKTGPRDPKPLTAGADFGSDSVRVVIADPSDGAVLGDDVVYYPRWKEGKYCDPVGQRFRQHPLDYLESLEAAMRGALRKAGPDAGARVAGLTMDTTGSTPVLADARGVPLALTPSFEEDPDAMFFLWKDHTSQEESDEIQASVRDAKAPWLDYVGGLYSSEWFWAKAWHAIRVNPRVAAAAKTVVEHCDWIAAALTGREAPDRIRRSRCAAGHKALWHASFGGYPDRAWFTSLDPRLAPLVDSLGHETWTSDQAAGALTADWAARLGLRAGIPVGVGGFDVHLGALGGGIEAHQLVKAIGTSCCDVLVTPKVGEEKLVPGICGQVDGSIVPGQLAYEAGQSAFGDVYAWFRNLLAWGFRSLPDAERARLEDALIPDLSAAAAALPSESDAPVALDWFNGRRTPDVNMNLAGAFAGLRLGSDAPRLFRALVESTAFGSRAIVERFEQKGVAVQGVTAIGGIARKSPFVMQTLADVLKRPIRVAASDQACALGSAMFAAVVAGVHPTTEAAKNAMFPGFDRTYLPDPDRVRFYDRKYREYVALGKALTPPLS